MTAECAERGGSAGQGSSQTIQERVRWCAYPSWAHFAWLYAFSLMAGARGLIALWWGMDGGIIWLGGAASLLVCAALLRRWARYSFSSDRVLVSNGYTGRDILVLPFNDLADITVLQGPFARFVGIGTVVLRSVEGDSVMYLRGVRDPDVVKTRLEALRP